MNKFLVTEALYHRIHISLPSASLLPVSLRSILVLSSHVRLDQESWSLPTTFFIQIHVYMSRFLYTCTSLPNSFFLI